MKLLIVSAYLLPVLFSCPVAAQITGYYEGKSKAELQQIALGMDSAMTYRIAGAPVKCSMGDFLRNDTIYYSDHSILRTSEASDGYLNGKLTYYYNGGNRYMEARYKNGEPVDTTTFFDNDGMLRLMSEVYMLNGTTHYIYYYRTGEIKEVKVMNKDAKLPESDQFYDEKGNTISSPNATQAYSYGTLAPGDKQPYSFVQEMPQYPGGEKALISYIAKHVKYPEGARQNYVQGKVTVRFVVDEKGKVTYATVPPGMGIGSGCDEEAIRVVSKLKKFKPGTQNGKPVRVWFTVPITFRLQ